jgi:sigma-B regulation protein RsbU (phosphoserine phosphatase)
MPAGGDAGRGIGRAQRDTQRWWNMTQAQTIQPSSATHARAATGRLLVVDDNEANRDMLSRRLQRKGYAVTVAEDGEQALALVAEALFDVILLDVTMPGIDGFEVLRRLRADHPPSRLPIIMATARDQREDIVSALNLGANDYVTKPLDFPVVLARVQTQTALKQAHADLEAANLRMKRDLDAAAKVQTALLPAELPKCAAAEFSWIYRPCVELAGDFLNVARLGEHHIGLYLLDVSGHGVPAALLSVTLSRMLAPVCGLSSLVRRYLGPPGRYEPVAPSTVARQLNQRIQLGDGTGQYFTMFYGVLDERTRELRYVTAGHPPPVHIPAGAAPRQLTTPEFPIGIVPEAEFAESSLQLEPGDRFYVYSDGISEAMDAEGELFGPRRVLDSLAETQDADLEESVAALVAAAESWAVADFDDDVSALALCIPR